MGFLCKARRTDAECKEPTPLSRYWRVHSLTHLAPGALFWCALLSQHLPKLKGIRAQEQMTHCYTQHAKPAALNPHTYALGAAHNLIPAPRGSITQNNLCPICGAHHIADVTSVKLPPVHNFGDSDSSCQHPITK